MALASACNPTSGLATHGFGEPGVVRSNLITYSGPSGAWLHVAVAGGGADDLTVAAVQPGWASAPDPRDCIADGDGGADDPIGCGGCNWWTPARVAWENGATTGNRKLVRVEPGDQFSFVVTGTDSPVTISLKATDDAGTMPPGEISFTDTQVDYANHSGCGGGE